MSEASRAVPPRPHDPTEREVVGHLGAWEVRQFPPSDTKLAYFTGRGFRHVQLWHAARGISVLTPSRLTGGRFEAWIADGDRLAPRRWEQVRAALPVATPTAVEVAAIERWFVLRHEPAEIHLLRVWWATHPRVHVQA